MTFTGTLADLNAALDGLNFAPTADFNGAASLQIVTSDQGNTGSGGPQSDSDTINITVNAVNDAPVNTVPGPQTTNEDTTLVFSSAGGNRISISDIDAAGNPLQVTLTAANGTISLSQLTGLSFTTGDGVGDAVMTFTGTLADLNAALDGLSFLSAVNFNGADSLQITTNDQGNTGSGGPQSDSDTVNITVNAVNDAPVNSVPGPQFTSEDTALVFSSAGGNLISISDVDAAGNPLQITLTATNGTITLSQTSGLSFIVGSGAGDAVMTFTGTLADLNAALDGLSFSPTPSFNGSASLQIVTNDQGNIGAGGPLSDADTVNIAVNAVDDAPILASVEPAPIVFVENDVPGNVTSTITIAEFDTGLISGASIQISANYRSGEDLLMFTNTATIAGSWNAATGTLSLSGLDTASNYQDALRAVRYQNLSEAPDVATRTLTWTAFDDTANASNSVSRDVTIVSVNDLPTLSVPGSQSPLGNTIVFTSANGTAILVSDVDAGATPVEITLEASQGFITLPSTSGITIVEGTGANDTRLVISGTLANVNQALDGLSFRTGATTSSLQIGVNDSAGGSGGTSQASAQISITAAPPAPPPVSPPSPPPIENLPELPGDSAAADNAALPVQAPPPSVSIDAAPQIDRSAGSQSTIQAITPVSVVVARPTRTVAAEAEFVEPVSVFGDDALRRASIYLADEALGLDLLDERRLWEEMQQISEALESELGSSWTVGAVVGAGAISAGYLLWLMRTDRLWPAPYRRCRSGTASIRCPCSSSGSATSMTDVMTMTTMIRSWVAIACPNWLSEDNSNVSYDRANAHRLRPRQPVPGLAVRGKLNGADARSPCSAGRSAQIVVRGGGLASLFGGEARRPDSVKNFLEVDRRPKSKCGLRGSSSRQR